MCVDFHLFFEWLCRGGGAPFFSSIVGTFAPSPYVAYIGKEIADGAPHPREEGKCERGSARERKMSLDLGAPLLRGRNVRSGKRSKQAETVRRNDPFSPFGPRRQKCRRKEAIGPLSLHRNARSGLWSEGKRNCLTRSKWDGKSRGRRDGFSLSAVMGSFSHTLLFLFDDDEDILPPFDH